MCCGGGGSGRDAVGLQVERFEQPLRIADAWCRRLYHQQRCCGYFRCEQRGLDHRCSQRGSRVSCSDIAAESRTGHLRRRRRFVIFILRLIARRAVCCGGGGSGRDAIGLQVERFEQPLRIADALSRRQWRRQRRGYFRCEQREVDHRCSQRGSKLSCSDIAA